VKEIYEAEERNIKGVSETTGVVEWNEGVDVMAGIGSTKLRTDFAGLNKTAETAHTLWENRMVYERKSIPGAVCRRSFEWCCANGCDTAEAKARTKRDLKQWMRIDKRAVQAMKMYMPQWSNYMDEATLGYVGWSAPERTRY
jgi:hypothetical protein